MINLGLPDFGFGASAESELNTEGFGGRNFGGGVTVLGSRRTMSKFLDAGTSLSGRLDVPDPPGNEWSLKISISL